MKRKNMSKALLTKQRSFETRQRYFVTALRCARFEWFAHRENTELNITAVCVSLYAEVSVHTMCWPPFWGSAHVYDDKMLTQEMVDPVVKSNPRVGVGKQHSQPSHTVLIMVKKRNWPHHGALRPGQDTEFVISSVLEERVICSFIIFSWQSLLQTIFPLLTRKWRKQANWWMKPWAESFSSHLCAH